MNLSVALPAAAAITSAISLILDYFPGVRTWFDSLKPTIQRDLALLLGLVVALVIFFQANPALVIGSWVDVVYIAAGICLTVITAVGSGQATKLAADKTLGTADAKGG